MRRIKLVLALVAAMGVLMMAAAPAMADGFRLNGGSGDGLRSFSTHNNNGLDLDNDAGDLFFLSSGLNLFSLNNNASDLNFGDLGDIDVD
jgi:hypothetical protein